MEYAPHTDEDMARMLAALGLSHTDELFDQVPEGVRALDDLGLADGLAEAEVLDRLRTLAGRNVTVDTAVCFLGGGAYDHYQPAVVAAVVGRGEFATAYTPYQPELSQGNLQALFEFQTLVSELLGLPIANSSLYDGASAVVEGVLLCAAATGRSRLVVAGTLDPRYRQMLDTYAPALGLTQVSLPPGPQGGLPLDAVHAAARDAAVVVVGHPNVAGLLEDIPGLATVAHEQGARLLVAFDPLLAGVLEPPGRLGADVVTADGLSAGNTLAFGGPGCGLLACRDDDVRRLPGRLVGQTVDIDGRRGYVLTLQAREQHIRREKATSNICTNQALNALATAVYFAWLGPQGLAELGQHCLAGAAYAAHQLVAAGVEIAWPAAARGKELALRVADPWALAATLAERGYLVGPVVRVADEDLLLVAVSEQRTRDQIDGLADAVRVSLRQQRPAVAAGRRA
ncbi:MAG: aminomethyl-transferring glycine dehydrogenase subunit GcvPA [Mycobacteriales bacterium]